MENKNIPSVKVNKETIIKAQNAKELELIPYTVDKIFLDTAHNYVVAIGIQQKIYCVVLPPHEGTHLTFVDLGCAPHAHMKTIYQMYMQTMIESGFELESSTIESKVGDIYYSRLCWINKKKDRKLYSLCGLGDGLILARLVNAKLYIVKNILPLVDAYDEWEFSDEHFDE